MLHWTPSRLSPASVTPVGLYASAAVRGPSTRSEHARMLAHAAKRRLAARGGEDAGYWKACAPAAVAKAAALRTQAGFTRLP
jgi:hypothetical protein